MRIVITYRHHGDDRYIALIKQAFASAKRFGYETMLVGYGPVGDAWMPDASEEEYLMNWILAAQLQFIESDFFNQDSVLFSPDALIVRPLEQIFEQDFDIGFTVRDNPRWPINNGVIFLKPQNKEKIADYWKFAISVCKSYPVETQKWYGDQQSVHEVYAQGSHEQIGLNVKLLPCAKYNASPRLGPVDHELLKYAYIVHFKGKRKPLMKEYWGAICKGS